MVPRHFGVDSQVQDISPDPVTTLGSNTPRADGSSGTSVLSSQQHRSLDSLDGCVDVCSSPRPIEPDSSGTAPTLLIPADRRAGKLDTNHDAAENWETLPGVIDSMPSALAPSKQHPSLGPDVLPSSAARDTYSRGKEREPGPV